MKKSKFVKFERELRTEKWIEYLTCNGLDSFIKLIKYSGILIKEYPGKNVKTEKLIQDIESYLDYHHPENESWIKVKHEASIINTLYQSFYSEDNFVKLKSIPINYQLSSYLATAEIMTREMKSKLRNSDISVSTSQNTETTLSMLGRIDSDISNPDAYLSDLDSVLIEIQIVIDYLMFYQEGNIENVEISDVLLETGLQHFDGLGKKISIQRALEHWKYSRAEIVANNHVVTIFNKTDELQEVYNYWFRRENKANALSKLLISKYNKTHNIELGSIEKYIKMIESLDLAILKESLFIDNLNYNGKITRGSHQYELNISDFVKVYYLLKSKAIQFLKTSKDARFLYDLCMYINHDELAFEIKQLGVNNYLDIMNSLIYSPGSDLFNTPLIKQKDDYLILPSIISEASINMVVTSLFNEFDFRGEGFENKSLKELLANKVNCTQLHDFCKKEEYQCDLAFNIGTTLYLCECKAWNLPHRQREYFNQYEKETNAITQIKRLSEFYSQNRDTVQNRLNLSFEIDKIHCILITNVPFGSIRNRDGIYIVDIDSFLRFIQRKQPRIIESNLSNFQKDYYLKGESWMFDGKITNHKLHTFLTRNPIVTMTNNFFTNKENRTIFNNITLNSSSYHLLNQQTEIIQNHNISKKLRCVSLNK